MNPDKQALTSNCLVNSILKHAFKYWTYIDCGDAYGNEPILLRLDD